MQFMNLPPEAIAFLKENKVPSERCPCCGKSILKRLGIIGTFTGGVEGRHPLYYYRLEDGRWAQEFFQAASPGPCFFLGLRVGTIVFKWPQSVIYDLNLT